MFLGVIQPCSSRIAKNEQNREEHPHGQDRRILSKIDRSYAILLGTELTIRWNYTYGKIIKLGAARFLVLLGIKNYSE